MPSATVRHIRSIDIDSSTPHRAPSQTYHLPVVAQYRAASPKWRTNRSALPVSEWRRATSRSGAVSRPSGASGSGMASEAARAHGAGGGGPDGLV